MTTLLLVRHGETDWNADGRLQGRPLSDFGRRQARELAGELEDEELDAIYSSDLARAQETAEIVGERIGLPVVLDPDLREKDWGNWEGLTPVERDRVEFVGRVDGGAPGADPARVAADLRAPSGHGTRARGHARWVDAPCPDGRDGDGAAGRRELWALALRVRERLVFRSRLTLARGSVY
jgi:hypothetical protein